MKTVKIPKRRSRIGEHNDTLTAIIFDSEFCVGTFIFKFGLKHWLDSKTKEKKKVCCNLKIKNIFSEKRNETLFESQHNSLVLSIFPTSISNHFDCFFNCCISFYSLILNRTFQISIRTILNSTFCQNFFGIICRFYWFFF